MSYHPSVSVVMPTYNAAETLYASVLSVQAQTCRAWELILVDDGSTDGTLEVARELEAKDHRIRVVSQANAGPAAARNTGIALARARIIAFLDADDLWHRHRLAACLHHFGTNPQAGIVFTRVNFVEPGGLSQFHHVVRPRICRDINVAARFFQQGIAHTATHEQGLSPLGPHRCTDRLNG